MGRNDKHTIVIEYRPLNKSLATVEGNVGLLGEMVQIALRRNYYRPLHLIENVVYCGMSSENFDQLFSQVCDSLFILPKLMCLIHSAKRNYTVDVGLRYLYQR